MKKFIFLSSWQFFYESIWHLRMCPLSFEYFGTLSKTSRAKFLISSFILKKFNFFDLHGLKKLQILTKSLQVELKSGLQVDIFSIFSKSFKSFSNVVQSNWDGPLGLKERNQCYYIISNHSHWISQSPKILHKINFFEGMLIFS